ncbi:MAG TPA: amidohydrolase family protein [Pirellulales bacterium]|jgi:N-acetylglucosamine-6-phosphate deacetylase|nr:amidohydrolase family protein [Pirellulales bacterium]
MKIVGRHYLTAQAVEIEIVGQRIAGLAPSASTDRDLPWIAPGWVDLQINGYGGQEFTAPDLTSENAIAIGESLTRFGVTRFCPTLTTASRGDLLAGLTTLRRACRQSPEFAALVAGIHLEGPYISAEDGPRGAHPRVHCRPPDAEEFDLLADAAEGQIRLVTLSPEFDGAPQFIARLVARGVRVAIGHTAATAAQIAAAVDAGATLSTHLGNGAHAVLRRHPNYLWDQLAEDRLTASLIVDGHHLPPAVVKTFVRAKTTDRIVLVSDLSGFAGLPAGRYETALCPLEILGDGRLVVAGQRQMLAGAGEPIGTGVVGVMRYAGVDRATALAMASIQPARVLGIDAVTLAVGDRADLVAFDLPLDAAGLPTALRVRQTIVAGRVALAG